MEWEKSVYLPVEKLQALEKLKQNNVLGKLYQSIGSVLLNSLNSCSFK